MFKCGTRRDEAAGPRHRRRRRDHPAADHGPRARWRHRPLQSARRPEHVGRHGPGRHEVRRRRPPGQDPTSDASTFAALTRSADANDCVATRRRALHWQAWFVRASATGPVDIEPASAAERRPRRTHSAFGWPSAGNRGRSSSAWPASTIGTSTLRPPRSPRSPTSTPVGELLPIALKDDGTGGVGYKPGQVVDLTDGKDIPGGFGYVAWFGTNDPNSLETSICTPNNPAYTLPFTVDGDPGKSNSSGVRACLQTVDRLGPAHADPDLRRRDRPGQQRGLSTSLRSRSSCSRRRPSRRSTTSAATSLEPTTSIRPREGQAHGRQLPTIRRCTSGSCAELDARVWAAGPRAGLEGDGRPARRARPVGLAGSGSPRPPPGWAAAFLISISR